MTEGIAHQALYRRWRAQTFSEIVGQEAVVQTLRNAVTTGRVAHAILFTGPRGTGKTSTARILAKMVNCEHGPTPEPCGTCEQCLRIREGTHLDVVEIDAASHGGVDDARDLRERAFYAPVSARFKVYIIDEAHGLTPDAFNALLKTLEEPPPHACLLLVTPTPARLLDTLAAVERRSQGVDDAANQLIAHGHGHDPLGALDDVPFLDLRIISNQHGAHLVFFQVQRQSRHLVGEIEQLVGHHVVQAVDARHAVAYRDDRAHFADGHGAVIVLDLLADNLGDFVRLDLSHDFSSPPGRSGTLLLSPGA